MIRNAGSSGRKSITGAREGQDFKTRTDDILKGKMKVSGDEALKPWLRISLNFATV